jgi:hypothetical protein
MLRRRACGLMLILLSTVLVACDDGGSGAGGDDTKPQSATERLADAVVIGSGEIPGGAGYQLFADFDSDEGLCVYLVPDGGDEADLFGECPHGKMYTGSVSPRVVLKASEQALVVGGSAAPQTDRVTVSYEPIDDGGAREEEARVYHVTAEQIADAQATHVRATAYFVAFIPASIIGDPGDVGEATASAYSDGALLGREPITWIHQPGGDVIPCDFPIAKIECEGKH